MSPLTRWLLIAGAIVLVMFAVNAVVYRIRFGTFLPRSKDSLGTRRALPGSEVVLYLAGTVAVVAGLATPGLAPGSAFAAWLAEPYATLTYFVWCFIAVVVLGVALAVWASFGRSAR